nr:hypothetical protein CFP56_13387 [Quercus suber]
MLRQVPDPVEMVERRYHSRSDGCWAGHLRRPKGTRGNERLSSSVALWFATAAETTGGHPGGVIQYCTVCDGLGARESCWPAPCPHPEPEPSGLPGFSFLFHVIFISPQQRPPASRRRLHHR